MKKFVAGAVMGFLLSWTLVFAAQSLDHNGVFWSGLNSSAKAGYVNGYSDAMQVSVGKLDNLVVAAELFRWKGAKKIIRQLARELVVDNQAPQDVVKRLNQLYSDPRYSELDLGSALQLLTMKAQEGSTAPAGNSQNRH